MRGKAAKVIVRNKRSGITPAYAGKSLFLGGLENLNKDHPRVCGEKCIIARARKLRVGITPAYAGKSTKGESELLQN